jgi:hypothetical protein
MKMWACSARLPLRTQAVIISMIQLLPGQFTLM